MTRDDQQVCEKVLSLTVVGEQHIKTGLRAPVNVKDSQTSIRWYSEANEKLYMQQHKQFTILVGSERSQTQNNTACVIPFTQSWSAAQGYLLWVNTVLGKREVATRRRWEGRAESCQGSVSESGLQQQGNVQFVKINRASHVSSVHFSGCMW